MCQQSQYVIIRVVPNNRRSYLHLKLFRATDLTWVGV